MPRAPLAALLVALAAVPAHALTLLASGKVATFRRGKATATIRVGRDPRLAALLDPTCPGTSSVQLAAYTQANRLEAQPAVALACERWRRAAGGFVYADPDGASGVRRIVYRRDKLLVKVQGGAYVPIAGPVGYLELWLGVGTERFLVRLHNFRRNDEAVIATRKPSSAAAEGERAFWDVLWGDDTSEARQTVALHCLARAAKQDRKDGRSRFLLAMMRLYRFAQMTPDYRAASAAAKAELAAARTAFDASVPLLWDGRAGDSRVPGFAAAARYTDGVVNGNAALAAQGLADLDAAVAVNPIFNLFDYLGVVPPSVGPADPLYPRVVDILDFALAPENAACNATQPEICGNAGMAPHNVEGAFVLFADLYAKGGVLANDPAHPLRGAATLYSLARSFATLYGWSPAFQTLVAEREATAAARVALYQDGDPGNDPRLIGNGPGEACATCHHK